MKLISLKIIMSLIVAMTTKNIDVNLIEYETFFIILILFNFCCLCLRFEKTSIVV